MFHFNLCNMWAIRLNFKRFFPKFVLGHSHVLHSRQIMELKSKLQFSRPFFGFCSVRDFEYTAECIIFDLLRIPLYHGWLVEPNAPEVNAIGSNSYNQLVEKIIVDKASDDVDKISAGTLMSLNTQFNLRHDHFILSQK